MWNSYVITPDKIRNRGDCTFFCDQHYERGVTLVNRSIVNVLFNNEQDESFKARQIRKRRSDNISMGVIPTGSQ